MKHNLRVTRNQRVERITEKTLVLGADGSLRVQLSKLVGG
jgi:hypothetical protein